MNGKSVEVDNTDAEGRLVLSGKRFSSFHQSASLMRLEHPRRHLVHFVRVQAPYTHRRCHFDWVRSCRKSSIFLLTSLYSAMVIGLGEVFSGVFSVADLLFRSWYKVSLSVCVQLITQLTANAHAFVLAQLLVCWVS